jgi:hypothetical protein
MLEFIFGFISGIYIGTHYNCKPTLQKIEKYFKTYFPPKEEKKGFFSS